MAIVELYIQIIGCCFGFGFGKHYLLKIISSLELDIMEDGHFALPKNLTQN